MKFKVLTLVLFAALFTALVAACSSDDDKSGASGAPATTQAAATPAFPLTIKDDSGKEVKLAKKPVHIVALAPSFVEVLFEVGGGSQVVAVDQNTDYPPEAANLPKLSGFQPSVEAIVQQNPDLVLIQYDPGGLTDSLTSTGIPVATLASPPTIEGVYAQVDSIGQMSGHLNEARNLVSNMREQVADVIAKIPEGTTKPNVYHEVDNTLYSVGPGSFIHDIYVQLQAKNIAESTGSAYPQLQNEAVISANPEVIILADEEFGENATTVAARPGWGEIAAVKNGRVYGIDPDIISRPGPRLPQTIQQIAGYLYPGTNP